MFYYWERVKFPVEEFPQRISEVEFLHDNFFDVYPNPSTDGLLYLSSSDFSRIFVYDITGNLLITSDVKKETSTINLSFLTIGTYLIKLLAHDSSIKSSLWIRK